MPRCQSVEKSFLRKTLNVNVVCVFFLSDVKMQIIVFLFYYKRYEATCIVVKTGGPSIHTFLSYTKSLEPSQMSQARGL